MADKGKQFSDNDMANPRITFHAPSKTLIGYSKRSLSDLKETVRKKLGLGSGSVVRFTQLRNGQLVDLDDDDDFDAFCAIANEQRHVTIQVALTENSVTEGNRVDSEDSTSNLPATPASALSSYGRLPANSSTFIPGGAALHKKFVLINEDGIEVNLETLTIKVGPTLPTPLVTARQTLPSMPTRNTAPIRIETPEQRQKRLEEEKRERVKEEEEKERLRRQEEEEKERLRKEDEAIELRRKEKKQKKMGHLLGEKEEKRRREQEEQDSATNSSTSAETSLTSSPVTLPSFLPSWTSINQTNRHPPPSPQSSYTAFVPNVRPHQQQIIGAGSGPPAYPRQLNGNGLRSQPGSNANPSQVPPGMSSPRLEAHHSVMPTPITAQKQSQVPWPGYYYSGPEHQHQHYMQSWNWAPPQVSPATQHPQHPPPDPDTSSVPESPCTHAPLLQTPETVTLVHAAPVPVSHPPSPTLHAPSGSMSNMSSPSPTSASALPAGRLNANSSAFVAGGGAAPYKRVILKNEDGIEVNLETLTTKVSPTPPRKIAPIRIETPDQRQKRLEEEGHREKEAKAKASAEEKAKREREEKEQRREEGRRKKEGKEWKRKEEEERERPGEEDKDWLRNPTEVSSTPTASVAASKNLFPTPTHQQQITGPSTASFW